MPTKINVAVEDHGVSEGLQQLVKEIIQTIAVSERVKQPERESRLKGHINLVVYNAYSPEIYKRNYNLFRGVSSLVEQGEKNVDLVVFNDTAKVLAEVGTLRPQGKGWAGNRETGLPPEIVPIQIEEGDYPPGWKGFTAPRPAYGTYLAEIAENIEEETARDIQPLLDQGLK